MKILLVLTLSLACLSAHATDGDKNAARTQEQVRRLKQQLQQTQQAQETSASQLAETKNQLEAQTKKAAGELGSLRRKFDESSRQLSELESASQALREQKTAAEARISELERQLAERNRQFAETSQQLQQQSQLARSLDSNLAQEKNARSICESNNALLYQYSSELLTRYRDKGVWSALLGSEPVTGIQRARLEGVIEEYRDKIDDKRLVPSDAQSAPASR